MSENAEQIWQWNGVLGAKWVAEQESLDAQLAPMSQLLAEAAGAQPGDHVLDVGCGCGATTLALAQAVGVTGQVVGVDVSTPMLARAAQRLAGLPRPPELVQADAQTAALGEARFDRIVSRFGVMFFSDPAQAFANLARALRPGGRLAFVCWRAASENPWAHVPLSVALRHVPQPAPGDPHAPGPFAFADAARTGAMLETAGFRAVRAEPSDGDMSLGGARTLDEAAAFATRNGPAGRLLRDAAPEVIARIEAELRVALAPCLTPTGVHMPYAVWVVTATR